MKRSIIHDITATTSVITLHVHAAVLVVVDEVITRFHLNNRQRMKFCVTTTTNTTSTTNGSTASRKSTTGATTSCCCMWHDSFFLSNATS